MQLNFCETTEKVCLRLLAAQGPWEGGLDQVTQITYPAMTAYSLPSGSTTIETMTYDPVGNLLTQTDRLGLTQTYTYTARNQVATITRNIGGSKTFGYDENGNLTSETDWKGVSFAHTYNALNQRTATANRLGHGMAMGYDLAGNLISQSDYNGNTTTFAYDRLSRQTEIHMPDLDGQSVVVTKTYYDEADPATNLYTETDPEGHTTTYTYNGRYLRETRLNALSDTHTWAYDDNGNLSSETDEESTTTSYTYDRQDRRTEIHRSGIRIALTAYDAAGNAISVTDARDNTIETDYDQWHRPWQVTQPGNITVTAYLDAGGNKTYENDGNGHERTWTYDARGLLLSYTDAESATTGYTYDANGNNETVTYANTAVTRTSYDAEDRELTVTEAYGSALARTRQVVSRDSNGNPLTVRDFNTNVTTYTYNPLNLPATITDADDKTAEKTYYRTGLVHTETDRRDTTTTYDYDALGRVTLVTDALTQTVATTYDKVGNVLTVTDKRGIVTENAYDDFYRLTETKRAATRLVTNEYDDAGNLTAVIDAENNRTEHTYNERNLKTATTFADSTTNAFTYDGNGNLLTATDEANQTTTYTYDNENRQKTVTFAGETIEFAYDAMGNKTEETKPEGNRRTWAYTLLGQLERVVDDPDTANLVTRFEYDANGNLRHQYDPRNNHVEYTYDGLNRKTAHIQHKAGGNLTVSFDAYDAEGNLARMTDAMGRTFTYTYDVLNRQTDSTAPDLGTAMFQTLAVTTVYDANNNVTSTTETKTDEGGATFTDQTVNTYDNFDRLATTTQRGLQTSYGYDNNGNRTSVTTPAGTTAYTYNSRNRLATATADGTTTYTYYADGKKDTVTYPNGTRADNDYTAADRIETITHSRVGDGSLISSYAYVYDANGNRTEQVEVQNGASETTTYAYDDLDRLTEFTVAGTDTTVTAYSYEGYNRKTETVTVNGTITKDRTYTYDDSDRLTVIDDTTDTGNPFTIAYTYDNNGNTLTKSNSSLTNQDETFVYNALNRLVETKRGPPAGEVILGRYDYNAAGLRVRHLLSERGNVDYYYDDHAVIEEHNADDDGLLAHYRYADRLISLDTGAGKQYYHHDALGSTVNLTTSLGDVQVSYKLDPWGHVREQVGSSVNRQVFTGQEMDENTGLIYFGARYYDPDTARFISQDSYLGESGTPPSLHRYLYAYSNPTVYVDALGFENYRVDSDNNVYWGIQRNRFDGDLKWRKIGRQGIDENTGKVVIYLTEEAGGGTVSPFELQRKIHDFYNRKFYVYDESGNLMPSIWNLKEPKQYEYIKNYIDYAVKNIDLWPSIWNLRPKSFFDKWINPVDDFQEDWMALQHGTMRTDEFVYKYSYNAMVAYLGGKAGAQLLEASAPLIQKLASKYGRSGNKVIEDILKQSSKAVVKYGDDFVSRSRVRDLYIEEVNELEKVGEHLLEQRFSEEIVAKQLNHMRRTLGIKYKEMTPPDLLDFIYRWNEYRYHDKLGPSYSVMRYKMGYSDAEIIRKSSSPLGDTKELGQKLLDFFGDEIVPTLKKYNML